MPLSFVLPTSIDLQRVEQEMLPTLLANDPLFKILPIEMLDADVIAWEQEDSFTGLQALRGVNGAPGRVTKTAFNRYAITPGVYGEFTTIEEADITKRRKIGTTGVPVDLRDLVADQQRYLLHRRLNRIRKIGWDLLTTGMFSVSNDTGSTTHTDIFPCQTFSNASAIPWSQVGNATPFADMKNAAMMYRGFSVQFDENDRIYMNKRTVQKIYSNINIADMFGYRFHGFENIQNLTKLNWGLEKVGLPQVVVVDGTYDDLDPRNAVKTKVYTDSNGNQQFVYSHLFLRDDAAIMVGRRTDRKPIGGYCITRHASNPNSKPGFFTKVVDSKDTGKPVPRVIEVHDHHNGAPKLTYPSAFVIIQC